MSASGQVLRLERGRHDKQGRRACLVEAATQVFAEKGYEAATTREVAERAGCSEGLIHRYFGGKRGLLLAALEQKAEKAAANAAALAPDRDDLHDEVRGIFLSYLAYALAQRDFMRVVSERAIVDPEVGRFIGSRLEEERVRLFAEKLRRHQRAGRVRGDVDCAVVARMISGLCYQSGFFLQVVFAMPPEEVQRIMRDVAQVIVRGIASPGGAGEGS
jgi:AcrR family transcriptional regulator